MTFFVLTCTVAIRVGCSRRCYSKSLWFSPECLPKKSCPNFLGASFATGGHTVVFIYLQLFWDQKNFDKHVIHTFVIIYLYVCNNTRFFSRFRYSASIHLKYIKDKMFLFSYLKLDTFYCISFLFLYPLCKTSIG